MSIKPYEKGVSATRKTLPGMLLLKPGCSMMSWSMSYNKGNTLLRTWGTILPNGEMVPHRDPDGNFGTGFFVQDAICLGWGVDKCMTFFCDVSDEDNWPIGSPAEQFYNEVRSHKAFKELTEKPAGRFAPISAPKLTGFIKGLLIRNAGKNYEQKPKWGSILQLPPSAKDAFEELLSVEANGANDGLYDDETDPYGWYRKYLVGDPIGFSTGKLFEFDKASKFSDDETESSDEFAINIEGGSSAGGDKEEYFEKYDCRIYPKTKGKPVALPKVKIAKFDQPFEDCFQYFSGIDQIRGILEPAFGNSYREALLYVFGGKGLLSEAFEVGRKTHVPPVTDKPKTQAPTKQAVEPEDDLGINLDGDDTEDEELAESYEETAPAAEKPVQKTADTPTAASLRERLNKVGNNKE